MIVRFKQITLALTIGFAIENCYADINGKVIGISDGDTIRLLDANNVQYRIRMANIDAPESRQAFGQVAKKEVRTGFV